MRNGSRIGVVIPALNEEESIGMVLSAIPDWADEVVVADNGSGDGTAEIARAHGARVVPEPKRGYGAACLTGIAALDDPDLIVFLDGDFSDFPQEMGLLVDPIVNDEADMVAGSRVLGRHEAGSLTPQARFGNWLACLLIRLFWKERYTDLGPFRAVRRSTLAGLGMRDRGYGWVIEMQIKATAGGAQVVEVPVSYRRRIGRSKVSGTVKGVVGAGTKILLTIFMAALGLLRKASHASPARRVVLFTRYPEAGAAKTRLIPLLGPEKAAELHRRLTEHTLAQVRRLTEHSPVSIEVRYTGGGREEMRKWLGTDFPVRNQGCGDLGARITRAFHDAFQEGRERVVLIGSDCPGLSADLILSALDDLSERDVVVGPAADGGYYLIGLRREVRDLFRDIPWGTDRVLAETLKRIDALGLSKSVLDQKNDVDRPEDLHVWEQISSKFR
jgi:rSAM/selenodomain-associated transferase 1